VSGLASAGLPVVDAVAWQSLTCETASFSSGGTTASLTNERLIAVATPRRLSGADSGSSRFRCLMPHY
jgi:hypothetical protein